MIYKLQSEPASIRTNTPLGILPPGIAPDKDPPVTMRRQKKFGVTKPNTDLVH